MKKYGVFIVVLVFITILNFSLNFLGLKFKDVFSQPLPQKDKITIDYPKEFFVKGKSFFEKQRKNQCGGYSSAYVLRYFGKDVNGKVNYDNLNHKFANGYVMPIGITESFNKQNIEISLYKGNIDTLKTRLFKANAPTIVLIGNKWHWQHYVTVTGYDKNNIYIYDSNKDTDNSKGYNRIMTTEKFQKDFNNCIPIFNHIYFIVDK